LVDGRPPRPQFGPVGPTGPDDRTLPAPGTETAWTWKFDWRLFARTYEQPFAAYLDRLGRSSVPVACINGELSRIVTTEVAARLAAHLPDALQVSIPEARHHLMLDQPIAFVAALRAVLTALVGDLPLGTATAPD
jgi:pimeloyl-ACP methyl ester carboxylesterase